MGSDPLFLCATAVYRFAHPPYVIGGLSTIWGYARAALARAPQHADAELRAFIRAYQRRALRIGKAKAIAEIDQKYENLQKLSTPGPASSSLGQGNSSQ